MRKMVIEIRCGCCDFKLGEVTNAKDMPKTIICPKCGVGGMPAQNENTHKTLGRLYPDEYFENQ